MRKFYIFISFILLLFGGMFCQQAHAKWYDFLNFNKANVHTDKPTDAIKNDMDSDYSFPLDNQNNPYDVTNYVQNQSDKDIKEAQIEKNKTSEKTIYDEEKYSRDLDLSSETVDFYTETSQYIAKGNARLLVKKENLQLNANEIIIDQRTYEITGIGNVRILKDGMEYFGDYIRINTKKESSFFDNPILYYGEITVNAKEANMYATETVAKKGTALIKKKSAILISTSKMSGLDAMSMFRLNKSMDSDKNNYKLVAKSIVAKRGKDRTDVTAKNVKIYRGKHFVGYTPLFTYSSDKDVNYVETIMPEIGNKPRVGTYIAPALVFGLPNASTIKFGPLVSMNTQREFGVGAFARLSTPKSKSELMYSTATGRFVADVEYDLAKNWRVNLGINDYVDNGWMGGQRPNYGIEISHDKSYKITQANASVRNIISAGLFQDDDDYSRATDKRTTMRYKWLVDMYNIKPILAWKKYLMLGYAYQHAFNLYQTGDTFGVVRAGPRLYTDLGRFSADVTYFIGGHYNESPFIFDRYRYGKNNVRLRLQYYINKYISIGYYGSANINERDYDGNWLTENQLVASVGTEDVKVRVGFDTFRGTTSVGFDMLLGSKKTKMQFDEMKVKDFDSDMRAPKKSKAEKKKKKKRF